MWKKIKPLDKKVFPLLLFFGSIESKEKALTQIKTVWVAERQQQSILCFNVAFEGGGKGRKKKKQLFSTFHASLPSTCVS